MYRVFAENDFEKCLDLFLKVFSAEPWLDKWASRDLAASYLRDYINTPGFIGYVAAENEHLQAMCFGHIKHWWEGDEYFIDEMCVDQDQQAKGLGSGMYLYIRENLAAQLVVHITLLTEKSVPACEFFKKQGMKISSGTVFMTAKTKQH